MKYPIGQRVIIEAVKKCSEQTGAADAASIANYIAVNYRFCDDFTAIAEELNAELSAAVTDPHYGYLDQDESARYLLRVRKWV